MNPDKIRTVYAPYSQSGENVASTPLEGYIDVAQAIYPAVNTGTIGKDGEWTGAVVSDNAFRIDATHEGVPNTGVTLSPQSQPDFIDMTGYQDIFLAIRVTNGGTYAVSAVMGPDTNSFANLSPLNPNANLKGAIRRNDMDTVLLDSSEAMTANVWNIFIIKSQLAHQKVMQFNVTNGSGGNSDITVAYMRLV
jgi:hypothetical protein